ncbi:hypothetical protein [Longitalea luteola]|uniref:hypothetical protein n=1 Tax=Longitalea luteola TaxID=2812563 RepID=UPI001A97AE0B|nr:hypothetical protein [Longitalea luteola]
MIKITELLKDKNGAFNLRELAIAIFILVIVISWIAKQFYGKEVPEYMFYSFVSLIAAGCFGYSIEKKST